MMICSVVKLTFIKPNFARFISHTSCLRKTNNRRPKQPNQPSSNKQSFQTADTGAIRNAFLKQKALTDELKGKFPTNPGLYFTDMYEREKMSLKEAIERHREFSLPEMLDSQNNEVLVHYTINMSTSKKTKFVSAIVDQVVPPFPLNYLPEKRVLAFCKEPEEIEAAMTAGALDAGGLPLVSKLEQGNYHWETFDFVVTTLDALPLLKSLRHVLRDKMPHAKNNRIHKNIAEAVKSFKNGVEINSIKLEGIPEIAKISLSLGQLSWDLDNLEANLKAYTEAIAKQCSKVSGFPFEQIVVACPPSDEHFLLDLNWIELPKRSHLKSKSTETDDVLEEVEEVAVSPAG